MDSHGTFESRFQAGEEDMEMVLRTVQESDGCSLFLSTPRRIFDRFVIGLALPPFSPESFHPNRLNKLDISSEPPDGGGKGGFYSETVPYPPTPLDGEFLKQQFFS